MRTFDVEQLNERMKNFQNPRDSITMDTSHEEFANFVRELTSNLPERRSTKCFIRELYLLLKQLKAGYGQRH